MSLRRTKSTKFSFHGSNILTSPVAYAIDRGSCRILILCGFEIFIMRHFMPHLVMFLVQFFFILFSVASTSLGEERERVGIYVFQIFI